MNNIMEEQFLNQSEKVQENLRKWWTPSKFDLLFHTSSEDYEMITNVVDDNIELDNRSPFLWKKEELSYHVPLFTETHLRNYIIEKTDWKVSIINTGIKYRVVFEKLDNHAFTKVKEEFFDTQDLLQVYWHIVCKIANN